MKKILVGYLTDGNGGLDKYLLCILDILSLENVKVDFLTKKRESEMEHYLRDKGAKIYEISSLKHPYQQYMQIRKLIQTNEYDVAYFNISEAFNCVGTLAAHKENIKKIIVHSHSSGCAEPQKIKRVIKLISHEICKRLIICKQNTRYFACSYAAANWMYTSKIISSSNFSIIYNAVDKEKYMFNEEIRYKKRKEFGISDQIVIGHIGGFTKPKNTKFLVDIINEVQKIKKNTCLLLVGDGPEKKIVEHRVRELKMDKHVKFLGIRNDVNELLQAMDVFVLPSYFEGLPFVAVEAQMSGLKTILSDKITKEVVLSDKCIFKSIQTSPKEWAKLIIDNMKYSRAETKFFDNSNLFDLQNCKKRILKLLVEED